MNKNYYSIVAHYESCLNKYGDTHQGVDWPKYPDAQTRYEVMLGVVKQRDGPRRSLLDFGCGASHLYEFMLAHGCADLDYSGLDLSKEFVTVSQRKFPQIKYYTGDILEGMPDLPDFDYIVMNGVFTEKCSLCFEEMLAYFQALLSTVFAKARIGIAFNVMSKHVDWEREELFHVPFDTLAAFLTANLTRNYVFRADYGLYEYTTYAYR